MKETPKFIKDGNVPLYLLKTLVTGYTTVCLFFQAYNINVGDCVCLFLIIKSFLICCWFGLASLPLQTVIYCSKEKKSTGTFLTGRENNMSRRLTSPVVTQKNSYKRDWNRTHGKHFNGHNKLAACRGEHSHYRWSHCESNSRKASNRAPAQAPCRRDPRLYSREHPSLHEHHPLWETWDISGIRQAAECGGECV